MSPKEPTANKEPEIRVLYEDNHLLVVDKPAVLATMGAGEEHDSLLDMAKRYLKREYQKPGNVYLGVVSRLDAFVTGVMVLARTSKAAARLNRQFSSRSVEKQYWALVAGCPDPLHDECVDWVRKNEQLHRMEVCHAEQVDARQARLRYRTLKTRGSRSLLEVQLLTGRKHQIRVQLAARGHPVIGDRKYGSTVGFPNGIALHSRRLAFRHPVGDRPLSFVAPLPVSWGGGW